MWRVAGVIILAGAALTFYGCREMRLAGGAGAEPVPITIAELSKGVPANPYRTLGQHAPVLEQMIYEGERNGSSVNVAYYPVTTANDPFLAGAKRGNRGLAGRVLVKVTRWKTTSELGSGVVSSGLTGMVINKVSPLSHQEWNFIAQSFPGSNPDNLIIFEEGRTPTAGVLAILLMLAGAAVMAAPVAYLIFVHDHSAVGRHDDDDDD